MDCEFRDGKLIVMRTAEEREPMLVRLRRIEGQVRGLIQMVESDRYCLDKVQQTNAVTAAIREVALLILSSHIEAGVQHAMRVGDSEAVTEEATRVIRAALKL